MQKIENANLYCTQNKFHEMFISVNWHMYVCIELWCKMYFLLWNVAEESLKIIHFEKHACQYDIFYLGRVIPLLIPQLQIWC